MIRDFDGRFDAAYDLRCYHLSKGGYIDSSTDNWEYLVWEPHDSTDVSDNEVKDFANYDESDEF